MLTLPTVSPAPVEGVQVREQLGGRAHPGVPPPKLSAVVSGVPSIAKRSRRCVTPATLPSRRWKAPSAA